MQSSLAVSLPFKIFLKVKRDVEGYDFYKHFGGRIKLMENAFPSKQLGDVCDIVKVEEIVPKEEPCFEQCDEVR